MDHKEQERIRNLGFFGIFKESFSLVFSNKKILSQITAATILPLCLVFFLHLLISEYLFSKIARVQMEFDVYPDSTPKYAGLLDISPSQWAVLWLLQIPFFLVIFIFYLLSTSAIVHTIACCYTSAETTFKKAIIGVVPKVSKRFGVTHIWNLFVVFIFNIVAIVLLFVFGYLSHRIPVLLIVFLCVFFILYVYGLIYIITLCQLATVATVLEDVKGIKAMKKSKALMKGKRVVALAIFLVLTLCYIVIQFVYQWFVVFYFGGEGSVGSRIGYAFLCFFLLAFYIPFGLIIQTVVYLVCKSNHRENIENSSFSGRPEAGPAGSYVNLKSKNVQLEQLHV